MFLASPHEMPPSCAPLWWWWHRVIFFFARALISASLYCCQSIADVTSADSYILTARLVLGWWPSLLALNSARDVGKTNAATKAGTKPASEMKPRLGFRDDNGRGRRGP